MVVRVSLAGSALERVSYGSVPTESDYGQPVCWASEGNDLVGSTLAAGAPCLIARLGDTELRAMSYFLRWRQGRRLPLSYRPGLRQAMHNASGFFPADGDSLDRFSITMLDATANTDVMGVWFNRSEARVINAYCPRARLVHVEALLSMLYEKPWSAQLAQKRVLVVHPFARSIESQYHNRRNAIFANPSVLPEFSLSTLVPVQSFAGNACEYSDWFEALSRTCERIGREDFDIALIGAGAYGLPLASFVKNMGRQAVHMGGATQLLFGIKGRRWEQYDEIPPFFNDAWVRPLPEEKPPGAHTVDGGAYW